MTVERVRSEIKPRAKLLQTGLGPDADCPAYVDDALMNQGGKFATRSVGHHSLGHAGRPAVGSQQFPSGSKKHYKNKRQ